jgi:FkbM family methyltransferase
MKSVNVCGNVNCHMRRVVSGCYYNIIAKFLPDKYYPYRFAGGKIYLNIKESPMMLERVLRVYERRKISVIKYFLKPGMTFIDVGSNKGDFSLIAARIMNGEGSILAFEPEPRNCIWTRKSIELNRYKNIQLFEIALGEHNETAKLFLGEKSGWHSLVPSLPSRNMGVIEVQKRTLDAVLEECSTKKVDMMKIDVEGFELMVLNGAYRTLINNPDMTILLDIHPHLGVDPSEVCNFLRGLGFSIYQMDRHRRLVTIREDLQEVLAKR